MKRVDEIIIRSGLRGFSKVTRVSDVALDQLAFPYVSDSENGIRRCEAPKFKPNQKADWWAKGRRGH